MTTTAAGPAPIAVNPVSIEKMVNAAKDMFLQLQQLALMVEGLTKGDGKVADICELLVGVRDVKDLLDGPFKEIGKLENFLSYTKLPDIFQNQDISTQTTTSGVRTVLTSRIQATAVDKERMMEWLRANGLESLIQPTVNASSLGAAVKEYMETNNKEPPADVIKVRTTPYVSITKTKKAAP